MYTELKVFFSLCCLQMQSFFSMKDYEKQNKREFASLQFRQRTKFCVINLFLMSIPKFHAQRNFM